MNGSVPKKPLGTFSGKTYAVPFGRYVGSSEVQPPADEVMVGREGQRAYLIDLLLSTGRRGAYLVTGRRGTGKSSFVKYCIAEYEASVFSRFLRGNVGRGVWDRVLVLLSWSIILLSALLVSELIQIFSPPSDQENTLTWIALAPLGIFLLYPCVYAKVALEVILLERLKPKREITESPRFGTLAAALVVMAAFALWWFPGFSKPAALSFFIPILCGCYLFVQGTSFSTDSGTQERPVLRGLLLCVYLSSIAFAIWPFLRNEHLHLTSIFVANLGIGLMLISAGLFLRGWQQHVIALTARDTRKYKSKITSEPDIHESVTRAMFSGSGWYCLSSAPLFLLGLSLLVWASLSSTMKVDLPPFNFLPMLVGTSAVLLFFNYQNSIFCHPCNTSNWQFHPSPYWILGLKSLLAILIALHLAYPLLVNLLARIPSLPTEVMPSVLYEPCTSVADTSRLCQVSQSGSRASIFSDQADKGVWLLSILALILIIHLVEYEWILRPHLRRREDRAFDPSQPHPWEDSQEEDLSRQQCQKMAELTLPWLVYKNWNPVHTISVNLGFDRLGHRQVIQAMLVGLRERYYRTFLAWNSGFANLGRLAGALLLLALMTLFTKQMNQHPDNPLLVTTQSTEKVTSQGSARTTETTKQVTTEGEEGKQTMWLEILDTRLLSAAVPKDRAVSDFLLFTILPRDNTSDPGKVTLLRLYHVLVFLLLLFVARWLMLRIPALPYRENLRRIDDLLDSLSVRTRITSSMSLWGPARWVYSFFTDERVRETERDPVDPRTVELAFLQILEEIQKGGFRFPGAARRHFSMPAPEITFIFDELDKLGTRVDPDLSRDPSSQESEALYHERERSVKLRALLSDLKNVLASAPARFIFVGGRDLHDEWLADQTSRQPLLTSIFNTEVYLPSLMTDHRRQHLSEAPKLHMRTQEYLLQQYARARYLHFYSVQKRWRPSFGLSAETLSHEGFPLNELSSKRSDTPGAQIRETFTVIECATGEYAGPEGPALLDDFALFLTHRSMGNPKKLKDLFASFIRQAGREMGSDIRWQSVPCRHVLRFADTEIFRIQLIVSIYRHLALAFEERMVKRDDKFAISIFFLTDFLFKFHRRAFSWSNLERVDDLAHIHRLPDLRDLQEEIVNHFSERFLHRMLNGMYAFRFRSDIANEVEYLSRQSAAEMAAFNFTLDESQSLKVEYETALKGKEEENPDLVAALGELYEFDQDFERARYYYRRAIDVLDKDLKELTAHVDRQTGEFHPGAPVRAILAGENVGLDDARRFLTWGTARLRLMLQIGMTFEHARDLERAEAEYRNARTLARSMVKAYVGSMNRTGDRSFQHSNRLHSLKHLSLLYQPLFAEVWLSEKFVSAIDTSISLAERGLWELRSLLPFVSKVETTITEDPAKSTHANFALTLSQLHNKAGDLYFFKGRQPVSPVDISGMFGADTSKPQPDLSTEGYLVRAHYHYAVGLHELRRYVSQRVESSEFRLSLSQPRKPTLIAKELPDFLFRAAAGGVNDMAEATLARVSLFSVFHELENLDVQRLVNVQMLEQCEAWFGKKDKDTSKSDLANWFGSWTGESRMNSKKGLLTFEGRDSSTKRLATSLQLCHVGASFFELSGYPEDAGRELLQVCETVTRYLWWAHTVEAIRRFCSRRRDNGNPSTACLQKLNDEVNSWTVNTRFGKSTPLLGSDIFEANTNFWAHLIETAILALRKADALFRESRYKHDEEESNHETEEYKQSNARYLVGDIIPPEALTILCSIGIGAKVILERQEYRNQRNELIKLLKAWTGESAFETALIHALRRHRYPMINRLNGLKIAIDSLTLGPGAWEILKSIGPKPALPLQQALSWAEELLDLNAQYDAPLHFTPLHSGTTCALLWLRWIYEGHDPKAGKIERVYRAARRDLHNSEEMYTLRRAYYEAISDLYYLYDDFNDRQIHFNHAIQMAGAELTAVLKHLIDIREKVEVLPPAFTEGPSERRFATGYV